MYKFDFLLLVFIQLFDMSNTSRRMYETKRMTTSGAFDCLYDVVVNEIDPLTFQTNVRIRIMHFCRQSISTAYANSIPKEQTMTMVTNEPITFQRLREMNITVEQLFNWYAPMDMLEDYQSGEEIGEFFNCSEHDNYLFGPKCQYIFDSNDYFPDLVDKRIDRKEDYLDDVLSITNGTCYEIGNDECESVICLDWREICDGKYLHVFSNSSVF